MTPNELRRPSTDGEWAAYHKIRRTVLFERRGRFGMYDDSHPDELRPENHPLLLFSNGEPVGTIRVDFSDTGAIFRRVAVSEDVQRRGHGRTMLELAERFVRERGVRHVISHADRGAVGFYERCGYVREAGDGDGATVLMGKDLEVQAREAS